MLLGVYWDCIPICVLLLQHYRTFKIETDKGDTDGSTERHPHSTVIVLDKSIGIPESSALSKKKESVIQSTESPMHSLDLDETDDSVSNHTKSLIEQNESALLEDIDTSTSKKHFSLHPFKK